MKQSPRKPRRLSYQVVPLQPNISKLATDEFTVVRVAGRERWIPNTKPPYMVRRLRRAPRY